MRTNLSRERSKVCRRCRQPWGGLDHTHCKRALTLKVLQRRADEALALMRYRDDQVRKAQGKLDDATQAAKVAFDLLSDFKAKKGTAHDPR